METYNLGKIEILRDPRSELKKLVQSSYHEERNNSGFIKVYGYYKEHIPEILNNLGFRLPSFQECIYLHSLFKEVNEFEYKRFWADTDEGTGILLIDRNDGNYVWSNPPESLKYILFAVRDLIPS